MIPANGHGMDQERRAIGMLLVAYGVAGVLLTAGLVTVLGWRHAARQETQQLMKRLKEAEGLSGDRPLPLQLLDERYRSGILRVEWRRYSALLDAVVPVRPLSETNATPAAATNASPTALIDFKVAYFDARRRLNERVASKGASMPSGLGMSETVGPDEETTTRLLQLAAIERLVTMALDTGISMIREIRPLNAGVLSADATGRMSLLQCPVLLSFQCSMEQARNLVTAVADARFFFALNRVKLEWMDIRKPDVFNVTVGYSVLVRNATETNREETSP